MAADVAPLYLMLLGPGLAWTMVHCGGMCGPIVAGLGFGREGWGRGGLRFVLFQLGRAGALAAAGAIAGMSGGLVADWLQEHGPYLILAVAVGMFVAVLMRLGWIPGWRGGDDGALAVRLLRPVAGWAAERPRLGAFVIGAILSALPCGPVYLALSLSASSGSALHGALLPALLVAISTPPLAIAAIASATAWRSRLAWVPTAALALSAVWLGMHGLAALEYVPHVHVGRVMLW